MSPETTKRRYELRKRAESMAATRERITEAAVELHGTIGPARTTISALAERAGVQRHTVYRHFPTDQDLLAACSGHFGARNPWPDVEPWRAIADPQQRAAAALAELYAYFERTESMWTNVLRDAAFVEAIGPNLQLFRDYLDAAGRELAAGWGVRGRRRKMVDAGARHVVDFQAWRSLAHEGGLDREQAVELSTALLRAAARPA